MAIRGGMEEVENKLTDECPSMRAERERERGEILVENKFVI
jgi:hypothetical protein